MSVIAGKLNTQHSKLITLGFALLVAFLVSFAPVLISGAVVAGLVVAALLLRYPVWGAYLLVLSVPVQKAVSYNAGPVEITVTQSLFVLALGIWWAWLSVRQDRRLAFTPIAVALMLYFVSMLASLWVTTSLTDSLAELSRWVVTILSYIIIVNSVQTRRQMNGLIIVMLVSAMFEAAIGLVQAYAGIGPASFNVGEAGDGLTRAYGTIGAPNSFAGYLDMTLPLALALAVYYWGRWASARKAALYLERPSYLSFKQLRMPLLMTFVTLMLFWTVLTTLSRGAWIGLTFGVLAMVLLLGKRAVAAVSVFFSAGLGLVVLGAVGALPSVISDRFGLLLSQLSIFDPRGVVPKPDTFAVVERMAHWATAGNMFLSSPWFGVGIGNFNVLFRRFGVQGWPISAGHAHNYYLQTLAETGIVGASFYIVMLIAAIIVGIRALRRVRRTSRDSYAEAVIIGAMGILVTFMVHNLFEDLHVLNMGIHWGAALALFTLTRKQL